MLWAPLHSKKNYSQPPMSKIPYDNYISTVPKRRSIISDSGKKIVNDKHYINMTRHQLNEHDLPEDIYKKANDIKEYLIQQPNHKQSKQSIRVD